MRWSFMLFFTSWESSRPAALLKLPQEDVTQESLARRLQKEQRSSKHSKIFWDYCDACDLVWLDPGELAKIQQERETMLQDHEYQEMRQHWSDRSPEQMTEFQKKLSRQLEAKPKEQPVSTFSAFLDFFFLSSND